MRRLGHTEQYKNGELGQALVEAFLKFDAKLVEESVIKELKTLAGDDENEEEEEEEDPVGRGEADVLRAEADLPLDELLAKYQTLTGSASAKGLRKRDAFQSPMVRAKAESSDASHSNSGGEGVTGGSDPADDEPGPSGSGCSSSGGGAGGSGSKSGGGSGVNTEEDMEDDDSDDDDDDPDEEYEWQEDSEEEDDDEEEEEEDAERDGMDESDVLMDMSNEELIVANAGDSRCVLCRGGKAVELSFDHKPEDEAERTRIEKAGGKVTADGRVNGGLNLSRAIGDHYYKRKEELPAEEQMITSLPDIKEITLDPEDQFFVVACDGICQEVVDYVAERLKDPEKRSKPSLICEELFDHCLAPNTYGDGTGCDNMTCVIVVFNTEQTTCAAGDCVPPSKRCAGDLDASAENTEKRPRVDETDGSSCVTENVKPSGGE
nr:hypothetical protein BaRGS_026253 [Batillaria attramentaria]